ncbi:MAG: zinc ABC transporter substrate-binding protein [Filomicrobium sp.]
MPILNPVEPTRRALIAVFAAVALAVLPTSIQAQGSAKQNDKAAGVLNIVASTGMIADAARQIGGDKVRIKTLMGPGVDPHAYRQTRTDIVATAKADLVLWNGLYLEAQMEGFFLELGKAKKVVAVAEAVPRNLLIGSEDYEGRFDPHLWMNPNLWARVVVNIRDAMIKARPEDAEIFTTNAAAYLDKIRDLARYTTEVLSSVPTASRVVLSSHDAFNYFGNAYGFEVVGIQGISTESEAGLKRIADLVDMLVERDIRAVFVETSVSDRNVRALIEGAAARGHQVKIGGELFSDAMGEPGTYEGTYIGMIDHNATTITRALGGQAPDKGMQGKLS